MPTQPSPRLLAVLALMFVAAIGCANESTTPATYPITGVVTLDGKPVAGALVQYYPANSDYTPLTSDATAVGGQATTADDGSYAIESTFDRGKTSVGGLPAGAYKVTVVKMEAPSGAASLDRPPKNALDPRYATVDTTPVRVTIEAADVENKLDIPL